jgi:hypothetical protein
MLSINNLHNEIEKRESRKNKIYHSILEKVQYRIITTNKKSNDCYCFYIVPTFMFGVPLYNMTKCIIFIMEDLISRGFIVNYTHPNLLFVSWKDKPKNINNQIETQHKNSINLGLVDKNIYENNIYHNNDIKTLEFKTDNLFN